MPAFSIILPLYNNEKQVIDALESVRKQTFTDFECIVIDEYSTDNGVDNVVEMFCKADTRFKLYVNCTKKEQPRYGAKNYGLSLARGKYILFLNVGTMLHENALMTLHNTLETNSRIDGACLQGASVSYEKETGIVMYDDKRVFGQLEFNEDPAWIAKDNLYAWNPNCYCIRRNAYEVKKPVFEFNDFEDYMFLWELLSMGYELCVIEGIECNVLDVPDDRIVCDAAHNKEYQAALATYKYMYYSKLPADRIVHDGITAGQLSKVFKNTINYFSK